MKDEVDKIVDLVSWLDRRIEQRIAQEREHWRSLLVDVIAEERARVTALLAEVTKTTHEIPDQVKQIVNQSGKTIVEGINRIFDPRPGGTRCAISTMMASRRVRSTKPRCDAMAMLASAIETEREPHTWLELNVADSKLSSSCER